MFMKSLSDNIHYRCLNKSSVPNVDKNPIGIIKEVLEIHVDTHGHSFVRGCRCICWKKGSPLKEVVEFT
jgi:hypothetical protein